MIETSTDGRVRRIALNRPAKRNALNAELCRELALAVQLADDDPAIGAILLTANGPAFCAGMDLTEAADVDPATLTSLHERIFTSINRLHTPLIAAVQGAAIAGGTGLVANAQIAVASPDSVFGLTEIRIGLWPVLVFRAVALAVGERRATELSLTGRTFPAEEALQYGLVTEIAENPVERATAIARQISEYSPDAIAGGLAYVRQIRHMDWDQGGETGVEFRERLIASDFFRTSAQAFHRKKT